MTIEPDWAEYPNFSRAEFACAHCGRAEMQPDFVYRLQELRDKYGKPLRITSGYRCPEYNAQISSTGKDGPHTTGRAVDIAISRGEAYSLLRLAITMGFTGIGFAQKGSGRFLHLDDLLRHETAGPRPTIWSY